MSIKASSLRIVVFALAVPALFAIWGCAEDCDLLGEPVGDQTLPTLASIQEVVFTPNCAVCHFPGGNPLHLDSEAASYDSLVVNAYLTFTCEEFPRVEPGDPDGSCLVMKIEGMSPTGTAMPPPPFPMLEQDQIDAIREWILDGALP